jgi:hypothetical protein
MTRVPIEGRVARILNLRELAINRGALDGVEVGMIFDVLDPKAEGISDPETGELLGSVYRPKVQVKVFAVEDRLALARTFKFTRVNLGGAGALGGLRSVLEPPNWVERHETLKTMESTWQDLDESESIVKTGDPVVEAEVVEGETEAPGSRTLEHPAAELDLATRFVSWLNQDGWDTDTEVAVGEARFDVVASRGEERMVGEVKARRNALSVSDVAQAIGWLSLFPGDAERTDRHVLVVGPAGVSKAALELLTRRDDLELVQASEDGAFHYGANVEEAQRLLLPGAEEPEGDGDPV